MGLKTFVFSSMGPTDPPSSPPMESPPTQTRTGSDLLAPHTLGGGVVGLGLGDAEAAAVWAGFGFVPPVFYSPFPRLTTTAAMIAAMTSTKTTSTSRRRRARWRRRRRGSRRGLGV